PGHPFLMNHRARIELMRAKSRLTIPLIVIATLALSLPLWSDVQIRPPASARTCYCDCDSKTGATACSHMCELPKYENRSWATSCHKKDDNGSAPPNTPRTDSSKDNGVQQARR